MQAFCLPVQWEYAGDIFLVLAFVDNHVLKGCFIQGFRTDTTFEWIVQRRLAEHHLNHLVHARAARELAARSPRACGSDVIVDDVCLTYGTDYARHRLGGHSRWYVGIPRIHERVYKADEQCDDDFALLFLIWTCRIERFLSSFYLTWPYVRL